MGTSFTAINLTILLAREKKLFEDTSVRMMKERKDLEEDEYELYKEEAYPKSQKDIIIPKIEEEIWEEEIPKEDIDIYEMIKEAKRLIKEGKIGEIKEQVSDDSQLKKWCKEAIENNKSVVEDYKKGNENSLNFLVGYVMKLSNKSANPQKVREILKEMI